MSKHRWSEGQWGKEEVECLDCGALGDLAGAHTPCVTKPVGLPTTDKERKAMPLWTFLMEYFPDTFLAIANVAIQGNEQHNPGQKLHWAREKSTDQMNTAFRHMWDYGRGVVRDTDGQYHLAKAIWRLSAELQLLIESEQK
jgi:hypothetical protein